MSYDVIITSKYFGHGDETLCENLMLAYLNTTAMKEDNLPRKIWFYGDGAYLTCTGSDAIDDIKALEDKGVEIATCGTCLNFYEIEDDVQVGSVKTMADFVELFGESEKIVTPA